MLMSTLVPTNILYIHRYIMIHVYIYIYSWFICYSQFVTLRIYFLSKGNWSVAQHRGLRAFGLSGFRAEHLSSFCIINHSEMGVMPWQFQPLRKILISWDDYSKHMEKKNMFQNTNQYVCSVHQLRYLGKSWKMMEQLIVHSSEKCGDFGIGP